MGYASGDTTNTQGFQRGTHVAELAVPSPTVIDTATMRCDVGSQAADAARRA